MMPNSKTLVYEHNPQRGHAFDHEFDALQEKLTLAVSNLLTRFNVKVVMIMTFRRH